MPVLIFAKGALAAFWLLALLNLLYPMGEGWHLAVNLIAGGMLLAHTPFKFPPSPSPSPSQSGN